MFSALGRGWRVVGTGLSFLVFGIGGVLLGFVAFPLLHVCVWNDERRQGLARALIRVMFRAFIGVMRGLGVMRYDSAGLDRLNRRGLLILANHPSLIDTVFMTAFVRNADYVVNAALWRNPVTSGTLRAAGYIRNDSGLTLIDDCVASLRKGSNLVIFPEGTRTASHGRIDLKRGAAQVAIRGSRDVTPVIIRCTPPTLRKGERWWHVPASRPHFTIEARDDIAVQPFIDSTAEPALAARHLNAHLEQYFRRESHAVT